MWINIENLQVVQAYLFGGVKFLDFLALLMLIDIVTGIFKAIKQKRLRSRNALFGYARKMLVFGVIIVANVLDNILGLNGAVAYATVLFYIANEGLSILENLAQIGVKVPTVITDKLHVINKDEEEKKNGEEKNIL
ncbi:phage holin family protein [Sutcliffiella horikoshii]|uniref:Phage holin family protein n=1 Tax=Sutcliffiella horikoshii TaxID=79883 RepID=A0A5D4SXC7_9BACI|nr:phage holin family protein [Sutcliffiella horikoshii]TYS68060.1 phage holin family protein [Sutcliffiella horikoshii]